MKKIALSALMMLTAFGLRAQEQTNEIMARSEALGQTGNNEIRLNMLTALIGYPELNYERFLADNMGIGLAAAFSLEPKEKLNIRWYAMPYYRLYFGDKKASGFFIEGNISVYNQDQEDYYDMQGNAVYKNYTNGGFGAAVGGKFLTRNGFIGEVFGGIGRLFGNSPEEIYPRVGISIGKRF
jgi:hypothetical protein